MKVSVRDRLAAPVVLIYWLLLVGGLVIYSAIRFDELTSLTQLWVGAIAGTALGQCLALRDYRLWVTVVAITVLVGVCTSFGPLTAEATRLWMAFVPATLCGWWSLSERGALAAFWFPAVLWMLSILDGASGQTTPDGPGIVLLGGLAIGFLVFLRVRETRRVGLWTTVAATPLAAGTPAVVLKEPPARHLARASWALVVGAITLAITAWVAPRLWQIESSRSHPGKIATTQPGSYRPGYLPCCRVTKYIETERARVKEYFDLGRGRDRRAMWVGDGIDCRVCEADELIAEQAGYWRNHAVDVDPWMGARDAWGEGYPSREYRSGGTRSGGAWSGGQSAGPSAGSGPSGGYESARSGGHMAHNGRARDHAVPQHWSPPPPVVTPPPTPAVVVTAPPPPVVTPPPPPPEPPVAAPPPPPEPPKPPPAAPTPRPDELSPQAAIRAPSDVPAPSEAPATTVPPARASGVAPSVLHWIVLLVGAAMLFQVVALALRPLRRLVVLRHLRRPFWDETVNQRVSNSWQLALVGLRDAGWRSTSSEAPRDFARRVGVEGLDRCATILERARHGIGLDAGDVSEMSTSADAAYRTARAPMGLVARIVAWLRWPLA